MSDPTIHVLSTRPLSPVLIGTASAAGIAIDIIPFISTEPMDEIHLRERVKELGEVSLTAVLTSTNAVEAVAAWAGEVREWTIFCIEAATREAVSRLFGEKAIAETAESAMELAQKIISRGETKELFFFCGDLRREELPSALRAAGMVVNEIVVYRTVATPKKITRVYDGVVFFSPSAVESFFSVNTVSREVPLFAIGGTTAAKMRDLCKNPVVISKQPDAAVLINQVIEYFHIS